MNSLELMIDEHRYIKRMLAVIKKVCYKVMDNEDIDYKDFFKMIDFVRNYADKHHHGKEEDFLFNRMVEELGSAAEKLVKYGMLVEHDLGRLFMQQLEEAVNKVIAGDNKARLDIIANAIGYHDLLTRHIDKEDNVVFTFAQNNLAKETLDRINKESFEYERNATDNEVQKKYIGLLESLENKYEN
ncbi:hemerythrin-like domain-containing protein [Natranaerovirga pectinivora]|uniref:Hemerythrin-like domain-containing protein n=1 Tax=Natranaerovirga pectinivora TaxID=682400 RepID=A0A4R3MI54_9FIRM|nr:hemerythrin domain-containing protein [Natranaerovirga pectinivora]TCT12117.1 hemerythrin-like domain-containing protein [Natranaerovirga pectinivora]